MNFFKSIFKNKIPGDASILNEGLKYAMEFGENFMQPIQQRLSEKFPQLNTEELNKYDQVCRAAMKDGHSFIYDHLTMLSNRNGKITSGQLADKLKTFMQWRYAWVDQSNLDRLFNQGMYYSWKDGIDGCVV